MRRFVILVIATHALALTRIFAGETPDSGDEFTKVKSEYADVLALQGTAKGEILTIARILRAKPRIAVDQTTASGEYCFNSGLGTMVHFATQPEGTAEEINRVLCELPFFPLHRTLHEPCAVFESVT